MFYFFTFCAKWYQFSALLGPLFVDMCSYMYSSLVSIHVSLLVMLKVIKPDQSDLLILHYMTDIRN